MTFDYVLCATGLLKFVKSQAAETSGDLRCISATQFTADLANDSSLSPFWMARAATVWVLWTMGRCLMQTHI